MAITNRTFPQFQLTHFTEVEIKRGSTGTLVKGRWKKGPTTDVVIEANVQPFQYKDIMQLPEADRTKEWIKLYSKDLIRSAKEGDDGYDADIVLWDGFEYKVMRVRHYQMGILDHWHAQAARTPISAGTI